MNKRYFSYIKRKWSKDFDTLKSGLRSIKDIAFEINEEDRFLVSVSDKDLEKVILFLQKSVKSNAWHDVVNRDTVYVIFEDSTYKLDMDTEPENEIWQKMKSLEEGIRGFSNLKEMILDSQYGPYVI